MATSKERFRLVFEAQETASRKIKALNKELAALGGPKLVKAQREIKKLERQVHQLAGTAHKTGGIFSKFTQGIAVGNIVANAVSKTMGLLTQGIRELGEAVMVAANVEELGAVLNFVGQRAGYTTEQIDRFAESLRKSGIAQKETNQAMLRAIQGNIRLEDAVKIGRIAQDAATIGQVNSSEAYQTLIDSIVKGRVVLLKSLGIQGTYNQAYKDYAKELGKTQVSLTQAERVQARLNLVFKGGEVIAGAYTTAMGFASKQLRSMDRHIQNLQVTVGSHFTPSLSILTLELTKFIKELDRTFKGESVDNAKELGVIIAEFTAGLLFSGKVMFNFGQIIWNVMETMVISPIEAGAKAIAALATALSKPWSPAAWEEAGQIIGEVTDIFVADWNDIQNAIHDADIAALEYEKTITRLNIKKPDEKVEASPAVAAAAEEARLAALREAIPAAITDIDDFIEEEVKLTSAGIRETTQAAVSSTATMSQQIQNRMGQAVGSMIDGMVTGRASMGEIFKGIAQDFISFFIKKALAAVVSMFIPGLGGLLGAMFDTPVNDKMAADQGRDFMAWFTKGALAEAAGGTEMAVGISQTNRIASVTPAGGGGGGGMVVMHVNVQGNIMSDQFVEQTIAPKLRDLVDSGKSALSVEENENSTGGRDVPIG